MLPHFGNCFEPRVHYFRDSVALVDDKGNALKPRGLTESWSWNEFSRSNHTVNMIERV